MLEKPHAELGAENPVYGPVQNCPVSQPLLKSSAQLLVESIGIGKLYVHPRLHARQTRILGALVHPLYPVNVGNGAVVSHHHTVKAHLLPEQICQKALGGGGRPSVDGAVAGHYAPKIIFRNGRLEGLSVYLLKLSFPHFHIGAVNGPLGIVKTKEMLCAGIRLPSRRPPLHPFYKGAAHGRRQSRILAVGFALSAHPGVPGNIQHRRQRLGDPHRPLLPPHNPADLLFQLWVPG